MVLDIQGGPSIARSIKGFQIERTQEEFIKQVQEIGLSVIGQSDQLVMADKLLYALRDVTATVDTIPLIASSVMSKKIAAGADAHPSRCHRWRRSLYEDH